MKADLLVLDLRTFLGTGRSSYSVSLSMAFCIGIKHEASGLLLLNGLIKRFGVSIHNI